MAYQHHSAPSSSYGKTLPSGFGSSSKRLDQTFHSTSNINNTLKSSQLEQLAKTARLQLQQSQRLLATANTIDKYNSHNPFQQKRQQTINNSKTRFTLPLRRNKGLDIHQELGVDLHNATVLSSRDMNAIVSHAYMNHQKPMHPHSATLSSPPLKPTDFHELQQYKKKLSQERYAQWENTIEAKRTQQQNAKKQESLAYEVEQQRIDEEEARYKDAERQRTLKETEEQLYLRHNDRVKQMMQGYTLSGLNGIRQEQINEKRKQDALQKENDTKWLEYCKQLAADAEREEQIRHTHRDNQKREMLRIQSEQLRELQERRKHEEEEYKKEGESMRQHAATLEREQREAELQRRQRHRDTNRMYVDANKEQHLWESKRQQESLAEDKKIQEYATWKERVYSERAAEQQRVFDEKQAKIRNIIDKQVDHLTAIKAKENERLMKAVEEYEIKEATKERSRQERAEAIQRDIEYSREQQILKNRKEKELNDAIEEEMIRQWKVENQNALEQEKAERARRREEGKRNQEELLKQIEERDQSVREDMQKEKLAVGYAKYLEEKEKQRFQSFVEEKTAELTATGRELLPVQLALRKTRPDRPFAVTY